MDSVVGARLPALRESLLGACAAAGRDPQSVRLVAVSKLQPAAEIACALKLGQLDFGENYAQELRDKSALLADDPALKELSPSLRWHFIGPLQRNKVNLVAGRVSLIHSVDSVALVTAIAARIGRLRDGEPNLVQDCLIEVNVGEESQKAGCAPAELGAILDAVAAQGGALRCAGLMCLPPQSDDPEASRRYFRALRQTLTEAAKTPRPHVTLRELSMGMSHDYAVAIAEGATLIRVGTALFGARPPRPS